MALSRKKRLEILSLQEIGADSLLQQIFRGQNT